MKFKGYIEQWDKGMIYKRGIELTAEISKRELFAAMAMQGSLAYCGPCNRPDDQEALGKMATECADALLKALTENL